MNADLQTLRILLGPGTEKSKNAKLKKLADLVEHRVECPECGDMGPHEHNGCSVDPTLLCQGCGICFDPPSV